MTELHCELCEKYPPNCKCPNGPWNDIDAGVEWLLADHVRLSAEGRRMTEQAAIDKDFIEQYQREVSELKVEQKEWRRKERVVRGRLIDEVSALRAFIESTIRGLSDVLPDTIKLLQGHYDELDRECAHKSIDHMAGNMAGNMTADILRAQATASGSQSQNDTFDATYEPVHDGQDPID